MAGKLHQAPVRRKRVLAVAAYTQTGAFAVPTLVLLMAGVDTGVVLAQPGLKYGDGDDGKFADDDDNNSKAAESSLASMTNDELMKLLDVSVLQSHLSNRMGSKMYEFSHD